MWRYAFTPKLEFSRIDLLNDTIGLFPEHPARKPGSMLELVAMPGVKLTAMQKSFRQLSASIAETETRLLQGSTLLEMFRPLFAKKLQPLRDGAAALNRKFMRADLAEIAGSAAALKAWLKSQHEMMRERERMDEAIAAIMIAPPKRKPRTK